MTDHSLKVAMNNIRVIDQHLDLLVADGKGNLSYVSWYNFLGRLVRWIKQVMMPDEVKHVYEAVFDTFETLNYKMSDPYAATPRTWTYKKMQDGKQVDRGFDHVAIQVLANPNFLQLKNLDKPEIRNLSRQLMEQLYTTLGLAMELRYEDGMEPWENLLSARV